MSLFGELRQLLRKDKFELEDFHTEIVAQVLRNSPELTMEWLRSIGAANRHMTKVISVETQARFAALEENEPGSRVDMVIRLSGNSLREIIFVESKVDSTENPGQLPKYAKVIEKQEGYDCSEIIYITRAFELPRADVIMARWFQFYQHLTAHVDSDGLAQQLKLFMEENKMAVRNQFTAIDSLALSNFVGATALMDETLWTEVSTKFEKILGKVSSQANAFSQLRRFNRYIMYVEIGPNWDFECLLGYWLPNADPAKPPSLGVELGVNPKSRISNDVIAGFRSFAKKITGWNDKDLDDAEWPSIWKRTSLSAFMGEDDHLKAIRDYFLSLLDEVAQFRSANPKLPWSTHSVDAEDERPRHPKAQTHSEDGSATSSSSAIRQFSTL